MTTGQLHINGEFVASSSSATIDVIDPSTCEVIGRVPDASRSDVDRAVDAARAAFEDGPWKTATAQERGRILFKLADIVRARAGRGFRDAQQRQADRPSQYDVADVRPVRVHGAARGRDPGRPPVRTTR
jgi:betaine-aldehyde dehydrogenase